MVGVWALRVAFLWVQGVSKENAKAPLQIRNRRHRIDTMYTAYALVKNLRRAQGEASSGRAELIF